MDILIVIEKYWAVILGIVGIIGAWTRYEIKLMALEDKQKDSSMRISTLEKGTDDFREKIQIDIQEIKTTLMFIREKLK